MPVTLTRSTPPPEIASLRERRLRRGSYQDRGRRLRIELVNNMPDSAVMGTQRQFIKLLEEAADDYDVRLGLMTLTTVIRSPEAHADMAELYRAPSALPGADAIIVTGAEPRAEHLDEEPFWRELTDLIDTARAQTHATLASCLGAHALVLHESGVQRARFARKWSGLYATEIATPHALLAGYRPGPTPHSRWNGLLEADLVAAGYLVLTRAGAAGVDMFARDDAHLTLCFQGHPEYESDTLAREFRRDISRIPQGRAPPHVPDRYYDAETEARLAAHVEGVVAGREAASVPGFAMAGPEAGWRARAAATVANWLAATSTRKLAANGPTFLRARWGLNMAVAKLVELLDAQARTTGVAPGVFRKAMRELASGVALLTAANERARAGCAVTSLASLSLSPASLLVCLSAESATLRTVRASGAFAINLLAARHQTLAARFANASVRGADRFEEGDWRALQTGSPTLADALAVIDCRLERVVEHATHAILIGAAVAVQSGDESPALIHLRSRFEALA